MFPRIITNNPLFTVILLPAYPLQYSFVIKRALFRKVGLSERFRLKSAAVKINRKTFPSKKLSIINRIYSGELI